MISKKSLLFLIALFSAFSLTKSQPTEQSLVRWMTIEEATKANEKLPRPMLIDVYTDWCGWCKVMMKNTFSDKIVSSYINNNFYPVRLNAETFDTIKYKDTVYVNTHPGVSRSSHQLAYKLLDGRLSYPTLVYIDRSGRKSVVPGYYDPSMIMPLLVYFAENIYQTTNYDAWEKNFRINFPLKDTTKVLPTPNNVTWLSLSEAVELNKQKPKKLLIEFYTPWHVSSNIMFTSTWNNPAIAKILNDDFYPVRLDATGQDTLKVFGGAFFNENKEHPFHQLSVAMLEGKMTFPAVVFFDENDKLIERLQMYFTARDIEPILLYFGENHYKTQHWDEFHKGFVSKNFN